MYNIKIKFYETKMVSKIIFIHFFFCDKSTKILKIKKIIKVISNNFNRTVCENAALKISTQKGTNWIAKVAKNATVIFFYALTIFRI